MPLPHGLRLQLFSPRELLLIDDALRNHVVRPRVHSHSSMPMLLPKVDKGSGGTVQGLAFSGDIYCGSTSDLDIALNEALPPPCCSIHPAVCPHFYAAYEGRLSPFDTIDVPAMYAISRACRKNLATNDVDAAASLAQAFNSLCVNDSERLCMLDLMSDELEPLAAQIVDDVRVRTSCPAMCLRAVSVLNDHGSRTGVVYESTRRGMRARPRSPHRACRMNRPLSYSLL